MIAAALKKAQRPSHPAKPLSINHDEQADVLCARFRHAKIVDSKPLRVDGMVMASLDSRDHIVGLAIMQASALA